MRRVLILLCNAALIAVLLVPGLVSPASAATDLGFSGFGDIIVDETNEHVFVSSGAGGSTIKVMDFEGNIVHTITEAPGALGMTIAGGGLYAAMSDSNSIKKYDLITFAEIDSLSVAPKTAPRFIVHTGDELWFSYGNCMTSSGIGKIVLATEAVSEPSMAMFTKCAYLAPDPVDPQTVWSAQAGSTSATIYKLDAAAGSVVDSLRTDSKSISDLALPADGSTLYSTADGPKQVEIYDPSDLTRTGALATHGNYPIAVDVTATGDHIAAGFDFSGGDAQIRVYKQGISAPIFSHSFIYQPYHWPLFDRGLEITGDGLRLFAVTDGPEAAMFHVFRDVTLDPTSLTLQSDVPSTTDTNGDVTLSGTLSFPLEDAAVAGGKEVILYAKPEGGSEVEVARTTTDGSGQFTFPRSVAAATTFRAVWVSDGIRAQATATTSVGFAKLASQVTIKSSSSHIAFNRGVKITAKLSRHASAINKQIQIFLTPYGGTKQLLATKSLDSTGQVVISVPNLRRKTTITAAWTGDGRYLPSQSSATVQVKAKVLIGLDRWSATSGKYKIYKRTVDPVILAQVFSNQAGQQLKFKVERRLSDGKTWANDSQAYFKLRSNSAAAARYLAAKPGQAYRAKLVFPGSVSNSKAVSPFVYFKVRR